MIAKVNVAWLANFQLHSLDPLVSMSCTRCEQRWLTDWKKDKEPTFVCEECEAQEKECDASPR